MRNFPIVKKIVNGLKVTHYLDFFEYIDQNYVDTINTSNLLDEAISDMLGKLDPHSAYIPKENLQDIQERMQGKFVGIGIQFRIINDSVTVVEPIKGGPSIKAGIKAGDIILEFDGTRINQMKELPAIVAKTKVGKNVKVKIWRNQRELTIVHSS